MLSIFCLRLASGLLTSLLLLSPARINPRFFRTHFQIALGLAAVALAFAWTEAGTALRATLVVSLVLAFLGSLSWSLEGAPGGRSLSLLAAVVLLAALALLETAQAPPEERAWVLAGSFTSAALLGTATTAMLLGHSYLIAPGMSIQPLMCLLGALALATVARLALAGVGLWLWTADHSLFNLEDETVLWLPLRWGLGFVAPLVLVWMTWQTARLRSTQSATGLLYVVVIFCFLGELTSQLLLGSTGFTL